MPPTTSVRRNIAANFTGSLWMGLMSLVFIPVYIRFMGMEAYGLVGLFATLQSLFSLLDLGLSTTLNREFARLTAVEGSEITQRKLLRTFEIIYWCVAVGCAAVIAAAAPVIAARWVHPEHLSVVTIGNAIGLMAVVTLFQWPYSLYAGGLQGAQRQVALNVINVAAATLRGVGAIVILWAVSPTVMAFFIWQAIVSLLTTAATGLVLWQRVGGMKGAAFDLSLLRTIWRFAAGMLGISLLATALTQIDKVIVSKLLPLRIFGYYTLAGTVAASLYRLVSPVFTALFPRFSQLVAAGDLRALSALYHRSCEAMSVVILPAAIFIAFFAPEVLLLWTRDPATVAATHFVLSALIVGTAMNGMANIPYALQLAYGWTRLAFVFNVISVALLVPAVYLLVTRYGVIGASLGWLAYNLAAAVVVPLLMHRRILRGEQTRLFLHDIGLPLLVVVTICAVARPFISARSTPLLVGELFAVACVVQVAAALTMPEIRSWIIGRVRGPAARLI